LLPVAGCLRPADVICRVSPIKNKVPRVFTPKDSIRSRFSVLERYLLENKRVLAPQLRGWRVTFEEFVARGVCAQPSKFVVFLEEGVLTMNLNREAGLKEGMLRIVLIAVSVAAVVNCAGCGRQLSAIKQNQLKLQEMVAGGNTQLADKLTLLERNQTSLEGGIKGVVKEMTAGMSSLSQQQLQLQQMVAGGNRQVTDTMAQIRKNQLGLRGGIESAAGQLTEKIAVLEQNQLELREAVQETSGRVVRNVDAVQKNQFGLQSELKENIEKMLLTISALQKDQVQLRAGMQENAGQLSTTTDNLDTLESGVAEVRQMVAGIRTNTQQLADKVGRMEQGQTNLGQSQGSITGNMKQLISSFEAIEKSLVELHKMVAGVQSNTEKVNARLAAIEQARMELQRQAESSSAEEQVAQNVEAVDRVN